MVHAYCTDPHFSLHNDLADFLLPTHKEVALQLQVSNYPGAHDIHEQKWASGISGMECWNKMVEWNTGME